MKSLLFVLFVVAVAEAEQVCTPNTSWKMDCNTCFCTSDGTAMGCTAMGCPPEKPSHELVKRSSPTTEPEKRKVCIPDTTWKMDCNTCFCNSDGTNMGCTIMLCPPNLDIDGPIIQLVTEKPSNENGALKLAKRSFPAIHTEERQCIPDTTWEVDCNSCFCNHEGTSIGCTMMACPPNPHYGALKLAKRSYSTKESVHDRPCEPGTIVKHYCNTCTCNKLGRVGRCTKMFCGEEAYNDHGTYRINPNEIFKN